jgi:hypothetical protein
MDFYIKQNSRLPILLLKLTDDVRIDYKTFNDRLENSAITFSMKDDRGIYKIANKEAGIVKKPELGDPANPDQYYLYYKFTESDTKYVGRFEGEFKVDFFGLPGHETINLGGFIAPIKENLYINILPSIVATDIIQN